MFFFLFSFFFGKREEVSEEGQWRCRGWDVANLIMILVWRSDPISISGDSYSFDAGRLGFLGRQMEEGGGGLVNQVTER